MSRVLWVGALGAVACLTTLPAPSAQAAESENCPAERAVLPFVAENTPLSPADKLRVQQGSAVTFAFEHELEATTMKFEAASSQALLSTPDIDSGTATLQPGRPGRFTFTSTKVTAHPGTVYWSFSFSHTLKNCNDETQTYSTPVRTLEVVGTGGSNGSPEHGGPETSPPTNSPAHLRVGITAARVIHMGRPTVAYVIDCTATCSGDTSFKAWEVRGRHRKATRAAALDFGPKGVSIKSSSGGHERFTRRYRGSALKKLRSMLRAGEVKLQVTVAVKDAYGKIARAQKVIWLRR
jgi:hypothetical protein